uniref:Rhodopsin domain-containing protein n=2 Tax=Bionectria ochroleuca TaxID=29856 RepID=A0A0B7KDL0_BIOOC
MAVENQGGALLAVGACFMTVAWLCVLLRTYVRVYLVKAFGLDDWLIVASVIFYTIHNIWMFLGIHYGTGRHHADLPIDGIQHAMMYWYLDFIGYALTMITSKASIAVFLLRITSSTRLHSWIIYISLCVTTLTTTTFMFVCMFQCLPIPYFWTRQGDGKCIGINVIITLTYTFSTFSIVTDYIFAFLPIAIVWNLKMKKRAKWLLVPIFLLGSVASSAVAVRFAYVETFRDADYLWATAPIAVWSNVEMGLAITAASLATLRPLVRTISASLGFSSSGGPSGPSGGPSHALNGTAAGSSAFDRSRSRTKRQLTRNEEDHDSDEFIDMTHFADHSTNAWAGEGNAAADHMSKIMITKETEVTVTSLPSDSSPPNVPFWKRKGSERDMSDNESQEVLRMEGTDDATKEHRPVVPKSFLPKRDGNQTQN